MSFFFFINSCGHSEFPLIAFQKYLNDEQQESSILVTSYYYLSYWSAWRSCMRSRTIVARGGVYKSGKI